MDYKYLAFCTSCGSPTEITIYILREYVSNEAVNVIYCVHCQKDNEIPTYLKVIARELE